MKPNWISSLPVLESIGLRWGSLILGRVIMPRLIRGQGRCWGWATRYIFNSIISVKAWWLSSLIVITKVWQVTAAETDKSFLEI